MNTRYRESKYLGGPWWGAVQKAIRQLETKYGVRVSHASLDAYQATDNDAKRPGYRIGVTHVQSARTYAGTEPIVRHAEVLTDSEPRIRIESDDVQGALRRVRQRTAELVTQVHAEVVCRDQKAWREHAAQRMADWPQPRAWRTNLRGRASDQLSTARLVDDDRGAGDAVRAAGEWARSCATERPPKRWPWIKKGHRR